MHVVNSYFTTNEKLPKPVYYFLFVGNSLWHDILHFGFNIARKIENIHDQWFTGVIDICDITFYQIRIYQSEPSIM